MAFNSIVDATLKMNAKMIAMGQSVDIQKMPRPKAGTQAAQKQATYTPSGTDVEKMLYPKNFKPRAFELSETKQEETQTQETNVTAQLVEEAVEEQKVVPRIIGDDDVLPRATIQTDANQTAPQKPFPRNSWESCKHYKAQGDRAFCREYLGWCAKGKCSRPKY